MDNFTTNGSVHFFSLVKSMNIFILPLAKKIQLLGFFVTFFENILTLVWQYFVCDFWQRLQFLVLDGLWKVLDGLGKVSDGLGKVLDGLGKVSDGFRKVSNWLSDGLGKVSAGLRNVSDGLGKVSGSVGNVSSMYVAFCLVELRVSLIEPSSSHIVLNCQNWEI